MTEQNDILRPVPGVSADALRAAGFRWGEKGTHTSRTIMLRELDLLLAACPKDATREQYVSAIRDDNCLRKRTVATRRLSAQRLSELYGLDPDMPLFRVMRLLWYADRGAHPLLSVLLALARDPLLRTTVPVILRMQPGEELARQQLTDALGRAVGSRLNESTLDKVVRDTAASWTHSGHLKGRGRKVRQQVSPTPIATTYAFFLGYAVGTRGEGLFRTTWARVLDASFDELVSLALDAKRLGLLDMSQSGGVIDISFSRLLTGEERRLIHGAD